MLLSFFISIHAFIIGALFCYLPLYLKGGLNFTGAEIGLILGVTSLNALVISFPLGILGDRYPARLLTRMGLAGAALALWGLAAVRGFWLFLLVYWVHGLSLQFYRQSLEIMLFKGAPENSHRRFGQFNAWRMFGMLAGILVSGTLLHYSSFPFTFQALGLLLLTLLVPTSRLPLTRGVRSPVLDYRRDFLNRPALFFATWLFFFSLHWGAEGTSLGLFLEKNLGLGPLGIAFFMGGEFIVLGLTAYAYGRFLAGRWRPMTFLVLGLLTSGAGHVLMTYPSLAWSFGWRAVHGVGDGLILMLTYVTISKLFHVDRVGGNWGLIAFTGTLGSFTGFLAFGPLGAAFGYGLPLLISGFTSLALIPLAYAGLRE